MQHDPDHTFSLAHGQELLQDTGDSPRLHKGIDQLPHHRIWRTGSFFCSKSIQRGRTGTRLDFLLSAEAGATDTVVYSTPPRPFTLLPRTLCPYIQAAADAPSDQMCTEDRFPQQQQQILASVPCFPLSTAHVQHAFTPENSVKQTKERANRHMFSQDKTLRSSIFL